MEKKKGKRKTVVMVSRGQLAFLRTEKGEKGEKKLNGVVYHINISYALPVIKWISLFLSCDGLVPLVWFWPTRERVKQG